MFIHHESCPSCGSRDNLGRYNDGSAWCFGCHYYEKPEGRKFNPTILSRETRRDVNYSDPPNDLSLDFSSQCWEWLSKYNVTLEELLQRQVRWSASKNQLVFIMDDGIWQARNFHDNPKSKYYTQGNVNDHLPIYHAGNVRGGNTFVRTPLLVLVEDCISAIKLGRQTDAMPLLGSNISATKLARIARYYSEVIFWLDADKYKESQGLSTRAKMLGLKSRVIYSELDPKEYSDDVLKERLDSSAEKLPQGMASG